MKNILRTTLTIATAGSLLFGVAACGGGEEKKTEEPAAPVENTEGKSSSFRTSFQPPVKVPEKWDGGSGWSEETVGKIIALPKAIAYTALTRDENTGYLNSNFFVFDAEGKIIGQSEEAKELDSKAERIAGRVVTTTKEGRAFIVYGQQGISKPDPTSTKKAVPMTIVTIFDQDGKQISRKTFDLAVNGPEYGLQSTLGAATIALDPSSGESILVDPIDGSSDKIPASSTPGAKWAGQVDGVDLFYVPAADPKGKTPGTLTNGSWKFDVSPELHPFKGFAVKGPYLSFAKVAGDATVPASDCVVIDAHTGKAAPGSDLLKGACIVPESANPDAPITVVGSFIAEDRSKVADPTEPGSPVLYDPKLGKVYAVPAGISFAPITASSDGIFYGTATPTGGEPKVASFDLNEGGDPKVLVDVQRTPTAISGNGIAVFSGDSVSKVDDRVFFMIPKK